MAFNIITDAFLPVRLADGTRKRIHFAELTAHNPKNPVIDFDSGRGDFNGALLQFAIGLFQTVMPPADTKEWFKIADNPPNPAKLQEILEPYVPFFYFNGEAGSFLQDLELDVNEHKKWQIISLLLDSNNGKSFFKKPETVSQMCHACTVMGFLSLHVNANEGGAGQRTSLRGGGPLTTVICGNNLWETIWLGVMDGLSNESLYLEDAWKNAESIFPWLTKCRTSEDGQIVTPETPGVHGLQQFWAMPRRTKLHKPVKGRCDICNMESETCYRHFAMKNYGNNYDEWVHSLSPHNFIEKSQKYVPVHGKPEYYGYRHWLGYLLEDVSKNKKRYPAQAVQVALDQRYEFFSEVAPALFVFGYDMASAKPRSWISKKMPLTFNHRHPIRIKILIRRMIETASRVADNTEKIYLEAKSSRQKKGVADCIKEAFWEAIDPLFGELLQKDVGDMDGLREQWFYGIWHASENLLEQWITNDNLERHVEARVKLRKFNRSKVIKEKLWPKENEDE